MSFHLDAPELHALGFRFNNVSILGAGQIIAESPVSLLGCYILGGLKIGRFSYAGIGCILGGCTIGRYCSIAPSVRISLGEHLVDWLTSHPVGFSDSQFAHLPEYKEANLFKSRSAELIRPETIVGNDVWIGTNSTLRRGVKVGHGAIIGAHLLVLNDVPPYAIVTGAPAKVIRYRFEPDLIQELLALEWWNYDLRVFSGIDIRDVKSSIEKMKVAVAAHSPKATQKFTIDA